MSGKSYNEKDDATAPTAILPGASVEDWFIAPTRYCATGKGKPGGTSFNDRYDLSQSDKDPVKLIPEECSVLRAWLDFLPDWWELGDDFCLNTVMLIVNSLEGSLTVRMERGDTIHGGELAYPAKRSWNAHHKCHIWEETDGSYTIPAGNSRDGFVGVGVVGARVLSTLKGSAAVWSISTGQEEPNLQYPL